jgi:hypothetical protein
MREKMQEKFYWLNFVSALKYNEMTKADFLEQTNIPREEFLEYLRADKNPPKEWVFEMVRVTGFLQSYFYSKEKYEQRLKFLEDRYVDRIWTSLPPCPTCGAI